MDFGSGQLENWILPSISMRKAPRGTGFVQNDKKFMF
jgi:hypothetical protein